MSYQELIYKNYLTLGFAEMNAADYERSAWVYDLDYGEVMPRDLKARILDIGCGMGHFLYYLSKQGYQDFLGVDIGAEQIEHCRKNVTERAEKVTDVFVFLDGRKDNYDLIVLNDVLEHFCKDKAVELLLKIRLSLKDTGRLIVKTPNMGNLFAPASFYIDFTHETGFSEVSIVQALKAAGFSKVSLRAEKLYISSAIKRVIFGLLRKIYLRILRFIVLLDRPGDNYPRIFSKNLIAVADK